MKMRWRIALGAVSAVVIAAGIIAAVPATRAAAGDFFAKVFTISSDTQVQFDYLPEGFEAQPLYVTGSFTSEGQGDTSGGVVMALQEQQALYQNGGLFLLIKTFTDTSLALPEGQAAEVDGLPAVLRTGLSGSLEGPPMPDPGQGATSGGENAGATSGSEGVESEMPSIPYANANSLTWDVDGTRVEILSNLPVEELQRIAEGLLLPD